VISRRRLLGLVAGGGAAIAAELLLPHRTIFLPPRCGWPEPCLASLIIPREDLPYYADGIASGLYSYSHDTEVMTLLKRIASHEPGKFHSTRTGRKYDWADVGTEYGRSLIDDKLDYAPASSKERKEALAFSGHPATWLPKKTSYYTDDATNWGPPEVVAKLEMDAIAAGVPFVGDSIVVDFERWEQTDSYRDWLRQRGQI
jgi:hypothetical protein